MEISTRYSLKTWPQDLRKKEEMYQSASIGGAKMWLTLWTGHAFIIWQFDLPTAFIGVLYGLSWCKWGDELPTSLHYAHWSSNLWWNQYQSGVPHSDVAFQGLSLLFWFLSCSCNGISIRAIRIPNKHKNDGFDGHKKDKRMLAKYSKWSIILYIPTWSYAHLDKTQTFFGLSSMAYIMHLHILFRTCVVNSKTIIA